MKKFLLHIFLFILFFTFVIGIYWSFSNFLIRDKANLIMSNGEKNIILGHSHAEFAFDDALITNTRNFGNSAEPYFYTYTKLKLLLENNDQIENVFLLFTNNSLVYWMDDWTWDERYLSHRFPFYSSFLRGPQLWILFKNNPIETLEYFINSLVENTWKILRGELDYINYLGKYSRLESEMEDPEGNMPSGQKDTPLSQINIDYLDKIIELCNEHGVSLQFVRSPQHPHCQERDNEIKFQEVYKSNYSKIKFYDFNDFPLQENEFADTEHLNYKGAARFSIDFNKIIEENYN